MGPPVDFDLPDLILRVSEAWELGKEGLYRKYWSYKKIMKISKTNFRSGSPRNRCLRFFRNFFTKKWVGIRNHEWDDGNLGSKSETTGALDPNWARLALDPDQTGPGRPLESRWNHLGIPPMRIPGFHSWFRIPAHFFVKIFRKNRKNLFFGLLGPK